jgi:hypothetical protein
MDESSVSQNSLELYQERKTRIWALFLLSLKYYFFLPFSPTLARTFDLMKMGQIFYPCAVVAVS